MVQIISNVSPMSNSGTSMPVKPPHSTHEGQSASSNQKELSAPQTSHLPHSEHSVGSAGQIPNQHYHSQSSLPQPPLNMQRTQYQPGLPLSGQMPGQMPGHMQGHIPPQGQMPPGPLPPNQFNSMPMTNDKSIGNPPIANQPNIMGQQFLQNPPMSGQKLMTNSPMSPPSMSMTGPPGKMQQPPMMDQKSTSGTPMTQSYAGSGPSLSGPPQMMPGAPVAQAQHNLSGPMMPGPRPPMHAQPGMPMPGTQQNNLPGAPMPPQNNVSKPPLPGQQLNNMPPAYQMPPAQDNKIGSSLQNSMAAMSLSGPGQEMKNNPPNVMGSSPGVYGSNLAGPPLPGQPQLGKNAPPQSMPNQYHPQAPHMSMSSPQNPMSPPGAYQGQRQQFSPGQPMSDQGLGPNPMIQQQPMPSYPQGYQQQKHLYQHHPQQNVYNQRTSYPDTGPGGYQPGTLQQQSRRLDPDQMPSPIQVIQDDQAARKGEFVTNQRGLVPPLVTTKFVVRDQGNASPRYIRSTIYTVPTTADVLKQCHVPFGLIISPMARVEDNEYEPMIVNMGDIGPVRCTRCKAYMCPFMQFIDAGKRFQCTFCKVTTEVPPDYFQHLDHTGQRMDRHERPELMLGTYEYLATKDYCRNNTFPKPPAIVFIIDVSYNNIKSGLVNLICGRMKEIIRNLPVDVGQEKTNMKIGFITYNNTVHFYNIKQCLAQPQMMIVGDVQDVFMPLLDGFLCDPEESEVIIDSLMVQIPTMFADTKETETILAPAIQAGLEALKASECVGKLMVFHSSLPIAEALGKLKNRDDRKLLGTDKEKNVLAPQNNSYNNLGQDCVSAGCSVDLFLFNNSYIDVPTISQVCRLTGGQVYKYTYFQAEIDGGRFITDVINNIRRPVAYDAVMRIRTSTGVRATDFYGHFFMSNTTDMDIASIDCDKAVAVEIKHDDKLTEDEGVYIQVALLYTSCSGVRRLRIINLSLKTSSLLTELYRACELDAIINFFAKQSVFKVIESTPKAIKDNLISRCANMLAAYRKNCASSPSSSGQLILPECMKLLPLYINCLLKSDALSGGPDMTIDDRAFIMQYVAFMTVKSSVTFFYPRLIPLHNIDLQKPGIPSMIRCSIDKFTEDGAFLLENGVHMFLWMGLGLNPQWVQSVFGSPSVTHVDTSQTTIPILDNPLNKKIHDIISSIRAERDYCMRLTLVRQRDKIEVILRHFLVEDRGNDGSSSYVDFLCHMHTEIRSILS